MTEEHVLVDGIDKDFEFMCLEVLEPEPVGFFLVVRGVSLDFFWGNLYNHLVVLQSRPGETVFEGEVSVFPDKAPDGYLKRSGGIIGTGYLVVFLEVFDVIRYFHEEDFGA